MKTMNRTRHFAAMITLTAVMAVSALCAPAVSAHAAPAEQTKVVEHTVMKKDMTDMKSALEAKAPLEIKTDGKVVEVARKDAPKKADGTKYLQKALKAPAPGGQKSFKAAKDLLQPKAKEDEPKSLMKDGNLKKISEV